MDYKELINKVFEIKEKLNDLDKKTIEEFMTLTNELIVENKDYDAMRKERAKLYNTIDKLSCENDEFRMLLKRRENQINSLKEKFRKKKYFK